MVTLGPEVQAVYASDPRLAHAIIDVEPQLAHILEGLLKGFVADSH